MYYRKFIKIFYVNFVFVKINLTSLELIKLDALLLR